MEWGLEKVLHDLHNTYDISYMVGFFKGLCCLGIDLDVSDCMKKLFGSNFNLEDTNHYNDTIEIFNSIFNYYNRCFDRGEVGKRLYGFQKMEIDTLDKGIDLCREISGFIEGIRIGFENYCETEVNVQLCEHLTKLHDLLTVFIERKCKICHGNSQINDNQNIMEFDNVFSDLILTIARQFRQNRRIAGLKTPI